MDTLELARSIVNTLEDKKGEDIVLMDIQELSDRMLNALADSVVEQVRGEYHVKGRVEGDPRDGWMLIDFGDVIVHLFSPDRRDYYRLEELWSRGKVLVRLQ